MQSTVPAVRLPDERLVVTKAIVDQIERDILQRRHIERYMGIAQYAYGTVVDCASGSGFGSYILSKRSDVSHVHGVDIDALAVQEARIQFDSPKLTFHTASIDSFSIPSDFLVCLETIEHLDDPTILAGLCNRTGIQEIVLSYPGKKSTHYNKFHKWDFVIQDIKDIFPKFVVLDSMNYAFDTCIVRLVRHERNTISPRRWNRKNYSG